MWSELFALPFLTGLCLAVLLPVLGSYLRLREEWLAALAYAHLSAAGALGALVCGLPPAPGGFVLAALAGAGKRLLAGRFTGGASYALLLLGGWSGAVLLAANQPMAERLGHALFDGQLYFAAAPQLAGAAVGMVVALGLLRHMGPRLLLVRFYPDFYRLQGSREWPVQTGFDVLAALALALATMNLGVMGGFALAFIPPWLAFRRAENWQRAMRLAVLIGVAGYVGAFSLALAFDQPFGPVLALLLVCLGVMIA